MENNFDHRTDDPREVKYTSSLITMDNDNNNSKIKAPDLAKRPWSSR